MKLLFESWRHYLKEGEDEDEDEGEDYTDKILDLVTSGEKGGIQARELVKTLQIPIDVDFFKKIFDYALDIFEDASGAGYQKHLSTYGLKGAVIIPLKDNDPIGFKWGKFVAGLDAFLDHPTRETGLNIVDKRPPAAGYGGSREYWAKKLRQHFFATPERSSRPMKYRRLQAAILHYNDKEEESRKLFELWSESLGGNDNETPV